MFGTQLAKYVCSTTRKIFLSKFCLCSNLQSILKSQNRHLNWKNEHLNLTTLLLELCKSYIFLSLWFSPASRTSSAEMNYLNYLFTGMMLEILNSVYFFFFLFLGCFFCVGFLTTSHSCSSSLLKNAFYLSLWSLSMKAFLNNIFFWYPFYKKTWAFYLLCMLCCLSLFLMFHIPYSIVLW